MTLEQLTPEKRAYIETHYVGDDDILLGLPKTAEEAQAMCKEKLLELTNTHGWRVGDEINGRIVESIRARIDHQDDSFNRGLPEHGENESFVDYIKRHSDYFFYTACICRRFKNPLSGIVMMDDEINGAIVAKEGIDYKKKDDIVDF